MKKLTAIILSAFLLLSTVPIQLRAEGDNNPASTKNTEALEAQVLLNRLDEIKNMDKSNLTSSEKKELRMEVRETKKTLKNSSNGVYLSVGAIIIIILLLILLL